MYLRSRRCGIKPLAESELGAGANSFDVVTSGRSTVQQTTTAHSLQALLTIRHLRYPVTAQAFARRCR